MTQIKLTTIINAPIEKVFDLSRNIDLHLLSTSQSKEKAVAGRISGLIEKGETVTWKAKHFGLWLTHKSSIPELDFPNHFTDKMEEGMFKSFIHHHTFALQNGFVEMTDRITYETPFGIFGNLFDRFILKNYLTNFITKRNNFLKDLAEKQHE